MGSNKTISVFGATGFIGSRFCKLTSRKCIPILREERKPESEHVLYLISTTHNYHIFDDFHKDVDTNLTVLLDVLGNLIPGKSVFNFISSWFVYGNTELPVHEDSICNPKGFYSITKRAAEQLIVSYCETFGISYRILRLSNVYGAGDKGVGKKKNALQYIISQIKENETVNLYYDGEFYRDYLHVDDVVRAVDLCLDKAPLDVVLNIGSGKKILFKEIIDIARTHLGSKSEYKRAEPPVFHKVVQVKDFYMDTTKLRELGFIPQIGIEQGIKSLCQ